MPDPTPITPPAPIAPPTHWYEGADAETIGYFTARGWDKDAKTAAFEASKAHREAEKFIGAPASELIRLPKQPGDAAWDGVYQRLGAPKEAKEYDFANVKKANGEKPSDAFLDAVRETAFKLKLSKDRAPELAQAMVKAREGEETLVSAEKQALVAQEKDKLEKNWGLNKEAHLFVAKSAANALGVPVEAVNALEGQIGYAALMNMFLTIGQKIGEDKFIRNDKTPANGLLTKDQAASKRSELQSDTAWRKRYLDGGVAELNEMKALNAIITGQSW